MGCGSSRHTSKQERKREADAYARRKQNGFKDEGLEKFRKETVKQKKHLRHVPDPIEKKKKQQQHPKAGAATTATKIVNDTATGGGYAGGFSEDTLQTQRNKLRHVKR
ncbi:hypothetical protein IV203_012544 [Nitzschia inconspicua]|uniref:Uncharacterized protein n=1 Tax=Nitzschia inconspicua TaxID=303405 RepID=A0A9K3PJE5_9STRA|nr:hypothetical protein IV203_012544 [Nitzschia inconspicua]